MIQKTVLDVRLEAIARRIESACRVSMPTTEEQSDDRLWSDRELIHRKFSLLSHNGNTADAGIRARRYFVVRLLKELLSDKEIPLLRNAPDREEGVKTD